MSAEEVFANQASAILDEDIGASTLSFDVRDAKNIPADGEFRGRIGTELLAITGVSGATFTVTRGIEGTTAVGHNKGALISIVLTAGGLEEMRNELESVIAAYQPCHYVVKNPATWNPAATSAADLDGCTTLAVGERVLCPSGTSVGIWVASSATVCVADPIFVVREGCTVRCVRSAGAPAYRQTSVSGPAAFQLIPVNAAISPSGGDDSPAVSALIEATAGVRTVTPHGQLAWNSTAAGIPNLSSQTRLHADPGTRIVSSQAKTGTWPANLVFLAHLGSGTANVGTIGVTSRVGDRHLICSGITVPTYGNWMAVAPTATWGGYAQYQVRGTGRAAKGTSDMSVQTNYGAGGSLNGLTLVTTINGGSPQTTTFNGSGNAASLVNFISTIKAISGVADAYLASDSRLVIVCDSAPAPTLNIGAGTANTALGFTAGDQTALLAVLGDRPFVTPIPSTTPVVEYPNSSVPQDIDLDFADMTFSGVADVMMELAACHNVRIHNAKYDNAGALPVAGGLFGFDIGGYNNRAENLEIDVTGTTDTVSYYGQNQEHLIFSDVRLRGATGPAAQLLDCYDSWFEDCVSLGAKHTGTSIGFNFGALSAVSTHCVDCGAIRCTANGLDYGFYFSYCTSCVLRDCVIDCCQYGILLASSTGILVDGLLSRNCATLINIDADSQLRMQNVTLIDPTATGCIPVAGSLAIRNLVYSGGVNSSRYVFDCEAASVLDLDGATAKSTSNQGFQFIHYNSTGKSNVRNVSLTFTGANGVAIVCAAGELRLENVVASGASCTGIIGYSGVIIIGKGCDFTGCSTPFSAQGATWNIDQWRGVTSKAVTTTNVTLTHVEAAAKAIETTGVLTGDRSLVIGVPAFIGATYTLTNGNTGAFTTTFKATASDTGFAVAQGKSAIGRINSSGALVRVTADT